MKSERNEEIRRLRFEEKLSVKEIAREFSVSEQRIRQILSTPDAPSKRRGVKPGTVIGPRIDSTPARLANLKVGGYFWVETTEERRNYDMRKYNPHASRLSPTMRDMEFAVRLFTAVGAKDCTDIRYLIEVKRTA